MRVRASLPLHIGGWLGVLVLALAAPSCGGGSSSPTSPTPTTSTPVATLTEDQRADMATRSMLTGIDALKGALELAAIRTSSISDTVDADTFQPLTSHVQQVGYRINCPLGGRVEVTGNISRNLDLGLSGTVQVDLRQTYTDCAYSPAAGQTVTVNGDPYLTLSGTLSYLNGAPATQQRLRWDGAVRWTIQPGGGGGRCDANLELNLPTLATAVSQWGRLTGSWCGAINAAPAQNAQAFGTVQALPGIPAPAPVAFVFAVPANLPNATLGGRDVEPSAFDVEVPPGATIGRQSDPPVLTPRAEYDYSFCQPKPAAGRFCSGPLQGNPATTNPTGGTPHYTFTMGVGYPFGLTLSQNGVLSGTPTNTNTAGRTYTFDVCAADQAGQRVCRPTSIRVEEAPLELVRYSGQFNCNRSGSSYECTGTIEVVLNRSIASGTRLRADVENSGLGGTLTSNGTDTTLRFNVSQTISRCPYQNPDRFRLHDLSRNVVLASGAWTWNREGCDDAPTALTATTSVTFQVRRPSVGCTWNSSVNLRIAFSFTVGANNAVSGSARVTGTLSSTSSSSLCLDHRADISTSIPLTGTTSAMAFSGAINTAESGNSYRTIFSGSYSNNTITGTLRVTYGGFDGSGETSTSIVAR